MMHTLYAKHIADTQKRWERAMESAGYSTLVVHSGSPIVSFLDDYVYPFRPNPLFLAWLPLTHHNDCVLIVRPGKVAQLWYYQPEDYWHLPPSNPDSWWADEFDVQVVTDPDRWKAAVSQLPGPVAALGDADGLPGVFAAEDINPAHLVMSLHLQRTRKTDYELACMRQATRIATAAHLAARDAFMAGQSEFDIHLAYLQSARQNDARLPYGNIVAINEHAAVLHYQQRLQAVPAESRSFLIDAGATHYAYASDITRTYAAHAGEFSDLIAAMDQVQLNLAGQVRAGLSYPALHLDAHRQIAEVLQSAGIITLAAEDAVACGLSSVFYPHGLGHFIGLQTHDVAGLVDNEGNDLPRPDGHPYLRLTRELEIGNVLTIEPGLYFIPSLLAKWRQGDNASAINWNRIDRFMPYGGIRIEDNVVVTHSGAENLTRNAFAETGK